MKREDVRLWGLCSFGIYPKAISSLIKLNITLDDLIDINSIKVKSISEKKSGILDRIYPLIRESKILWNLQNVLSIYILYNYDAPLEAIKLLDRVGISYTYLGLLPMPKNYYDFGIDDKSAIQILDAFNKSKNQYSVALFDTLKQFEKISSEIVNLLRQNSNMTSVKISYLLNKVGLGSEEEIYKVLRIMRSRKDIEQYSEGISLPRSQVSRYINSLDDKTKVFFSMYSRGKSIYEIVSSMEISNLELSKIVTTLRNRIQKFPEDKHKFIYENYFIEKNDFKKVFDVDDDYYTLLAIETEIGKLPLKELLKSDIIAIEQKQMFYSINPAVDVTYVNCSEVIPILESVVKRKYINPTRISELYNDYRCEVNKKYIAFSRRLDMTEVVFRKTLNKFPNIVYPSPDEIRFYYFGRDFSAMIDLVKIHLEKEYLISFIDFFEVNKVLMSKFNINNHYELTQIFKYLNIASLFNLSEFDCYLAPNNFDFSVFLLTQLHSSSPISESKFVELIIRKYGISKKYIMQLISKCDQIVIQKGMFKSRLSIFDIMDASEIKELADFHFMSVEKYKQIAQKICGFYDDSMFNIVNFYTLNLRYQDGILYDGKFTDLNECIDDYVSKNDLFNLKEIDYKLLNFSYFKKLFSASLERFDILQYSDYEYISIKKLLEVGIDKDIIVDFLEQIKTQTGYLDFFSFSNVKILNENFLIDRTGFDEQFIRNLVLRSKGINFLQYSGKYIFSYNVRDFTLREVVLSCLKERHVIDVDELLDEIKRNYDIIVTRAKLKSLLVNSSLYINDTMERIYTDKKYYLKEVEYYYGH